MGAKKGYGMKEQFISWRPSSATRELLSKTEEVLTEYQTMGYRLTLRQQEELVRCSDIYKEGFKYKGVKVEDVKEEEK